MCPVCREPMVAFELEGVEIDRCLGCGGTWLDAGELEMLTELAGVPAGELSRAVGAELKTRRTRRRCPRCPRHLREFRVGVEPEVEVDRCPSGHGLWFDRGEMESVIGSFAVGEEGAVAAFFADLYGNETGNAAIGDR